MREAKEIKCMNLRSQNRRAVELLEAELGQQGEQLHFMTSLTVLMSIVAGLATGAMLALSHVTGIF